MSPSLDPFGPWVDGFGRTARALRVSITDRCNLRCVYCMPASPVWLPAQEILSYEELARLVLVATRCGIEKIRITGGEPLARPGVPEFISRLRSLNIKMLSLTTNGTLLAAQARALADAGLNQVTVSLDTLRPERFEALARRPGLSQVLEGMDAAEQAGFFPLKVNAVIIRGHNDDEIVNLATWGREFGRHMRFIEFMPLEGDHNWDRSRVVEADEIIRCIAEAFPLKRRQGPPNSTSEIYDYADGRGSVAVIASVTRAFCASCDRVRVTADGGFRTCLFATQATDLRQALRAKASDEELAYLMRHAVAGKGPGHLIGFPGFVRPDRAMNAIGG